MADQTDCCPVFDPKPWDRATHEWTDKLFLTRVIPQVFHMPLPGVMNRAIQGLWKEAEAAGIAPEQSDYLLLAHDPSPWKSELFMSVTAAKSGVEGLRSISGRFVSLVFDGPYYDVPRYLAETKRYLADLGMTAKKYYLYYTTCPKCAKKYGHNWIVTISEV